MKFHWLSVIKPYLSKLSSLLSSPHVFLNVLFLFCILILLCTCATDEPTAPKEQSFSYDVPLALSAPRAFSMPRPPGQPPSGPGGAEYKHEDFIENVYGEGGEQYWLFEPATPTPISAPLLVLLHGWGGVDPLFYGAWIRHLVRRGNIVVFPYYQENMQTPPFQFTSNAINAVKDAIGQLQSGGHVMPELDKFAIFGHSWGGIITANMAVLAKSVGLPAPKALMPVCPGVSLEPLLEDFTQIPTDVLMLVVVASEDNVVGDTHALKIFYGTPQISLENKDFITVVSDYYGYPPLMANHGSPAAAGNIVNLGKVHRYGADAANVNALDYYGYWKLFDGLTDAAFYGINRQYALGNTPEQRFMGLWSDGRPVNELIVTDTP